MTEAEKIICKMYLENYGKYKDCNEYKLLMGLLEQEPCEEQEIYEKAYKEGYDKGWSDGNFIGANKWIPVSERLPKDDEDVLVQMTDYSMMVDFRTASSSGWFWAEKDDLPIAWMPLPEPYKAESEETHE